MRAITVLSFALACGLTCATVSAQQGTPGNPPGQPSQPGQPGPGQPTPPRQPEPGQPGQPGQPSQPGQPARPGQPGSQMPGSAAEREVTLTGCVARDSSSAAAGQAAPAFLLTQVRPTDSAAGGPAGQSTAAPDASKGVEYRLMAAGKVDFAPHVNHQVRLTGTVMNSGAAGAPAARSGGAAAAPAPMFHVTSLAMVSATCDMK